MYTTDRWSFWYYDRSVSPSLVQWTVKQWPPSGLMGKLMAGHWSESQLTLYWLYWYPGVCWKLHTVEKLHGRHPPVFCVFISRWCNMIRDECQPMESELSYSHPSHILHWWTSFMRPFGVWDWDLFVGVVQLWMPSHLLSSDIRTAKWNPYSGWINPPCTVKDCLLTCRTASSVVA